MAAGSGDKTARVFEVVGGREMSRLDFEDRVDRVAFSPDGRYVAAGIGISDNQGAAIVFEAVGGKEVMRLQFQGLVESVSFSPDARYLTTASVRGENELPVELDLLQPQDLMVEACSRLTANLTRVVTENLNSNILTMEPT